MCGLLLPHASVFPSLVLNLWRRQGRVMHITNYVTTLMNNLPFTLYQERSLRLLLVFWRGSGFFYVMVWYFGKKQEYSINENKNVISVTTRRHRPEEVTWRTTTPARVHNTKSENIMHGNMRGFLIPGYGIYLQWLHNKIRITNTQTQTGAALNS